jgi:hypothetical protein
MGTNRGKRIDKDLKYKKKDTSAVFVLLSDVEREDIVWMMEGFIPMGKLVILEGEKAIDISKLRSQSDYVTLDEGYGNTASCESAITYIDGEQGILRYRGYPIEELAEHSRFVEVAYLLLNGELRVKDGMIVLPSGRRYPYLQLPPGDAMLPEVARALKKLVAAGGIIAGQKPVRSPSLSGYPNADTEVKKLGGSLYLESTAGQGARLRRAHIIQGHGCGGEFFSAETAKPIQG